MRQDVRALLFDFDGLLVDTEGPAYESWREVYGAHGVELALERWAGAVGTVGHGFDPLIHLAELVDGPIDEGHVVRQRVERQRALLAGVALRPGVADYLSEAERLGLRCAIVTSNTREAVSAHLQRLNAAHHFELIEAADGDAARAKPAPTLYLSALARLNLGPGQVIVFEDSPNGVAAAKAAGIYCVAVPNAVTASLDLNRADLRLSSMADLPLSGVLAAAHGRCVPEQERIR